MGCGDSKSSPPTGKAEESTTTTNAPNVLDPDGPSLVIEEASVDGIRTFSESQFQKTSEYDYLFKLIIIGDQGVGKSSLLSRFADDEFHHGYKSTVGVDFKIRTIELDGKTIKLQMWDTAGQERFRTVTNTYFRGSHGVIMMYDCSDEKTFENLKDYWVGEVSDNAPHNSMLMVIGNKCDLPSRAVKPDMGKEFAEGIEALFLETSAKESINVKDAFISLSEAIKKRII